LQFTKSSDKILSEQNLKADIKQTVY